MTERSIEAAARSCAVGERTLRRWLRHRDFAEAYCEACRVVMRHVTARLQVAAGEAVETLNSALVAENSPWTARVSAARTILDQAHRALELTDLETRVAELERLTPQGASRNRTR